MAIGRLLKGVNTSAAEAAALARQQAIAAEASLGTMEAMVEINTATYAQAQPSIAGEFAEKMEAPQSMSGSKYYQAPLPVSKDNAKEKPKQGTASLFNQWSLFMHNDLKEDNSTYGMFNNAGNNKPFAASWGELTLGKLLELFPDEGNTGYNKNGSAPYFANDFLWLKYYDQIPLNRMITLRRFAFPTFDNLLFATPDRVEPLSQAVTYFGEPTGNKLSEILKLNGMIDWKTMKADVWDVEGQDQANTDFRNGGLAGGMFGNGKIGTLYNGAMQNLNIYGKTNSKGEPILTDGSTGGANAALGGREENRREWERKYGTNPEFTGHVAGPVNVIKETHIRGEGGIGKRNTYKLEFEYKLSAYDNINPKMAMLDLLANILSLCYNNAKFWGGRNRFIPNQPEFDFFGGNQTDPDGAAKHFYAGDYGKFFEKTIGTFKTSIGNIGDALKDVISGIMSGNFGGLMNLGRKVGATWLDLKSKKGRPQALGFRAILSGLPVGEWAMVVGDPRNPIASIGNLIMKDFTIEFNDELGYDNFPTEMKLIVNLEDAMARDKGAIESMFNNGGGRMYVAAEGNQDVGNQSSSTQQKAVQADSVKPKADQQKVDKNKPKEIKKK